MTDSSSPANQAQTTMLERPVKYAPVTRQNWRPHVVKRPISVKMIIVDTAARAHALTIHHRDVSHSLLQSSVGVHMSIPVIPRTYLDRLVAAVPRGQLAEETRSRRQPPAPSNASWRS